MSTNIVEWDDRYSVGVPLIDEQHKKLIDVTNKLFKGCLRGDDEARRYFMKTIHEAVSYVKYHFSTEEKIFERINYPNMAAHKAQHQEFVKEVIREVTSFQEGRKFVPNKFVRFLKDWILTHIAVSDKQYAVYLAELKKQGKLYNFSIKNKEPPADPENLEVLAE
jgi:hemerythrin